MSKVFITAEIPSVTITLLRKKGISCDINRTGKPLTKHELKEVFANYEAVISSLSDQIEEDVIHYASPGFKVISNYAVGIDNIDVLAAKRKGVIVTNTPGVAGEAVAEHTFGLILACSKSIIEADKYVRQGKFDRWIADLFVSPQIWGKTIGIVGLGRIGTYVGHIAFGGFRMNILYHDIEKAEDFEMLTEAKFVTLEHLLKDSDIVTLHLPLTAQSRHLLGREEFKMMKNSAILINTARGSIIEEEALVWALKEKEIAAAGLDVYEHEPEVSHELLDMPNVVLTPHTASATEECRNTMAEIAAQNVIDVFEGKEPFGLIKVE
ncbi:MAG: D-glycerate dehydrogenase [Candidatus Curtissbacteria bacterium]|nr:D-glycerate dehydrogenase [Candidatus Curtissbacteria bacterium]